MYLHTISLSPIYIYISLYPFFHICSNSQRMIFLQFVTHSVAIYVTTGEKNETDEEAPQNKGADARAPQDVPNPQSLASGGTSDVSYFCLPSHDIPFSFLFYCLQLTSFLFCNLLQLILFLNILFFHSDCRNHSYSSSSIQQKEYALH